MTLTHIALCGFPKSGKTEFQNALSLTHLAYPIDDGRVLRDVCKRLFDLTEEQVTTQDGKKTYVEVCGVRYQVRDLLGTVGELLEKTYGEMFMPETALRDAERIAISKGERVFSYASVRKNQGLAYRAHGGLVVEIRREGAVWSGYEFDRYDESLADIVIHNDGTLDQLAACAVFLGANDWLRGQARARGNGPIVLHTSHFGAGVVDVA